MFVRTVRDTYSRRQIFSLHTWVFNHWLANIGKSGRITCIGNSREREMEFCHHHVWCVGKKERDAASSLYLYAYCTVMQLRGLEKASCHLQMIVKEEACIIVTDFYLTTGSPQRDQNQKSHWPHSLNELQQNNLQVLCSFLMIAFEMIFY